MPETNLFSKVNNLVKIEIAFLVDLVALGGFFTLSSNWSHLFYVIPLLIAGTLASFSAALFNNVYDTDIDGEMKRVSARRETIKENRRKYSIIASIMLLASFIIGILFLTLLSVTFILLGFASYVFLYTIFLKRRTDWNIVIGGIAGSLPALAGSAAFSGIISYGSIFIALLVFMWTPTHFWSLSIKYVDDYRKAEIPMLPVTKGVDRTIFWILVNTIILFLVTVIPAVLNFPVLGILYRLISIPMALLILIPVIILYMKRDEKSYKTVFGISNFFLMILLIAICLMPFSF
ncbi:MAG: heme o synthase [Thermoplasmataceae archaeon]